MTKSMMRSPHQSKVAKTRSVDHTSGKIKCPWCDKVLAKIRSKFSLHRKTNTFGASSGACCASTGSTLLMVIVGKWQYNTYFRLEQRCLEQHNMRLYEDNSFLVEIFMHFLFVAFQVHQ